MKTFKIIIIIFLFQFIPIALNANEKDVINNIKINDNNNLLLSLNNSRDNSISLSDKNKINYDLNKKYLKKMRGYLAMGISGIILTSLAIPVDIITTALFWWYLPGIANSMFILLLLWPLIPFLAIGLPFIIYGFISYKKYKKLRSPNPFLNIDNNKNINMGLSLKVK